MRHIDRQYLTCDPTGRPLTVHSEQPSDDGDGNLQLRSRKSTLWCSGCRRPVSELSELRGACDVCRTRGCCVYCITRCQVCSRRLCGRCRHGFAGPPPVAVCSMCQHRLSERRYLADQMAMQSSAFQEYLSRQRLQHQAQALQITAQRNHVMARLQAARWGLELEKPPRPLGLRLLIGMGQVVWWLIRTVFRYVWRYLR